MGKVVSKSCCSLIVLVLVSLTLFMSPAFASDYTLQADKAEKLSELCKKYEEWFSFHAMKYDKNLGWGSNHVKFDYYRVPQTIDYREQVIARILIERNMDKDLIGYVTLSPNIPIPFYSSNYSEHYNMQFARKISISSSPANSSSTRSTISSLFDSFSSFADIDQGAYIILHKWGDESSFFVDCSECANILVKFLKDAMQIINPTQKIE